MRWGRKVFLSELHRSYLGVPLRHKQIRVTTFRSYPKKKLEYGERMLSHRQSDLVYVVGEKSMGVGGEEVGREINVD